MREKSLPTLIFWRRLQKGVERKEGRKYVRLREEGH